MGGGGLKFWGYRFRGYEFWTSQKFRFPTITIYITFWTGGKNSLDTLKLSMIISADIFAVLLRYF